MHSRMESVLFRADLSQRSLIIFLVVAALFHGVASLRCYTCENARDNDECNKKGPTDCEPTMDTCQTIVYYSDVSEKLSINKICTMNVSCGMQVNETLALCENGMTTSSGTSACTTCCSEDLCNVSSAPITISRRHSMLTSLLACSFLIAVVTRAVHSLDDMTAPE